MEDLWADGQLPGWDGLYRRDGSAREVDVRLAAGNPGRLVFGAEFDLDERLVAMSDAMSTILGVVRTPLPDGSGGQVCGECAHGSEGYFGRLDSGGNLLWVVYQAESNPFVRVRTDGSVAVFTNNLDLSVAVDLNSVDLLDRSGPQDRS